MPRLKIDDLVLYNELDISKEEIFYDTWRAGSFNKKNLIPDIEDELKINRATDAVPPHQTKTDLYDRMKGRKHWDDLYKKIKHSLLRYYTKEFKLVYSWANKSDEQNQFNFHVHTQDITCVYYLQSRIPEFGTNIERKAIVPSIEDSLLIFDGSKISHKLCNMPYELAIHPHNHRYSIVFDFNIDKSKNPDNITK